MPKIYDPSIDDMREVTQEDCDNFMYQNLLFGKIIQILKSKIPELIPIQGEGFKDKLKDKLDEYIKINHL